MTKEEEFLKHTEDLKRLTSQVNNSGISAWEAGKLLKIVKDKKIYVSKYGIFENYTEREIGINYQTANNYIVISEKFTKSEIGDLMLVTHLKVIAEIKNDGTKVCLKSF